MTALLNTFPRNLLFCGVSLIAAPLIFSATAAASSSEKKFEAPTNSDCAINYATFEEAIPHINLKYCPGGEASDKVFCRAKTGHDEIVVFKFSAEGDKCLLNTKTYDDEHFNLTIFDLVVKKE